MDNSHRRRIEVLSVINMNCMSFNITGYHCLQFQTRSDTDDGRVE